MPFFGFFVNNRVMQTIKSILISLVLLLAFPLCSLANEDTVKLHHIDRVDVSVTPSVSSGNATQDYKINLNYLSRTPQFLGGQDAIRTLQLMPGVQTTGDIVDGLYIQGCEPSHNLFTIHGAPIYSPVHLLGFLPAINSNHLKSMSVDKGYISPEWGSRLASVVELETKDFIAQQTEVSGEVSIIASAVSVNTPIKDSGNVVASARMSYANPILSLFKNEDLSLKYNMYDANITWNQNFGDKDKLSVNAFYSSDKVDIDYAAYSVQGDDSWMNAVISTEWVHSFSSDSELYLSVYNTRYEDEINFGLSVVELMMSSAINDVGYNINHSFRINDKLRLKYGNSLAVRAFDLQSVELGGLLGSVTATTDNEDDKPEIDVEWGVYSSLNYVPTRGLTLDFGLRYSGVVGECSGLEPRLGVEYKIMDNFVLSSSYTRQYQYVNQVQVSGTGLPVNYYVDTSGDSPAQRSDNLTLGLNYKTLNKKWEFSALGYGRYLKNQYENTSKMISLIAEDNSIYSRYELSDGYNVGSEFMIKYDGSKLKAWVSYTLSWAVRQSDEINDGAMFYASNDRRHDLSVVAFYPFHSRWSVSSAFVYASGEPMTLSQGLYLSSDKVVNFYSDYNEARMPDYHRLDLTLSYDLRIKWMKSSVLNLAVYNVYSRPNPLMYTIKVVENTSGDYQIKVATASLFTIIPSLGLTFKF